ncbi:two pore domain potassium channel family protein, partial [Leptolyngbya sp. FACHB-36]|uniref:potassium channel family protein n=1 Tax=Leptolyngbya sp. FACHB-36 TaxID=2692808 RepID=UPI00167FE87F
MHSSLKRILVGVSFFSLTITVAVLGYMLAGWDLMDSLYMVVITIFGVGFGEVRPITTPALRIFTMLVIVAGYTSVGYILSGFLQMITEGG